MIRISPSQIQKWRTCPRAYVLEYRDGFRPPQTEVQAYGEAHHAQVEAWLRDGTVPGPGVKQGIRWLPSPSKALLIEQEMVLPVADGVEVFGRIDLVSPPALVIDHKTTSDLRWAKTAEELAEDPQALLYASWVGVTYDVPTVTARWVYYAVDRRTDPPKPRGAMPIEVQFELKSLEFLAKVERLEDEILAMVAARNSTEAGKPNPNSCRLYKQVCPHEAEGRCCLSETEKIKAFFS